MGNLPVPIHDFHVPEAQTLAKRDRLHRSSAVRGEIGPDENQPGWHRIHSLGRNRSQQRPAAGGGGAI
jgi:hypothetical protein